MTPPSNTIIVDVFIPCFMDQLYPETAMNMVQLLESLGCIVRYNKSQTCCGQAANNSGFTQDSRKIAQKFIKDFKNAEQYIVIPSGSCTGFVKRQYGKLMETEDDKNNANRMITKVYEFTQFLEEILHFDASSVHFPYKVTYHDGCGSLRDCGIKNGPRSILNKVSGLQLIENKECETCCGFGGTFSTKFEAISTSMAQTKIDSALTTDAEYIVSADASCLLQLQSYISAHNKPIQSIHIIDLLSHSVHQK